jgi:hypothetical protein
MASKRRVPGANPEDPTLPANAKASPPRPAKELVCGILAESILTSKGQVTIPQAIRARFPEGGIGKVTR